MIKPIPLLSGREAARALDVTHARFNRALRSGKVHPDCISNDNDFFFASDSPPAGNETSTLPTMTLKEQFEGWRSVIGAQKCRENILNSLGSAWSQISPIALAKEAVTAELALPLLEEAKKALEADLHAHIQAMKGIRKGYWRAKRGLVRVAMSKILRGSSGPPTKGPAGSDRSA